MSSRRRIGGRRASSSSLPATAADERSVVELASRLRALLPPEAAAATGNGKVPSAQLLQETCSYIRRLHREVDGLAERLSDLLPEPSDRGVIDGADAAFPRLSDVRSNGAMPSPGSFN
ncbi:transcription factor ILI7-like [Phragmites australis]|uniref:transcription factor ILI7-like n=1 Tax=Phragmites australis TaxID=29695 RepID=UPI002D79A620|nr:transcription factor ILI7-like [Phragmites australis]